MKTAEQLIEELGIQDLDTFMESAEFDQLDEISKETLGSYIKKAKDARQKHVGTSVAADLSDGIKKATKKLSNKKLTKESIESLVSAVLDGDQESASAEFEQLDELSKDTLASYVGKAAKSYNKSDKQLGLADKANFGTISSDERKKYDKNVAKVSGNKGELSTDDYDKHDAHHMDKLAKRDKGMKKAVSKLTKESLESLVSAVLDGDQESASAAFSLAMSEKISGRMDSIKQEIASGL